MRLTEYLEETDVTLTALAAEVGCHASTLHDIKSGRRQPSLGLALAIQRATRGRVSPEDMAKNPTTEAA